MNVTDKFKLNDTISFEVYPSSILGDDFKRVKVLAVLDADSAKQYIDIVAMHVNIYPTLPVGTPNSWDGYPYLKVQMPSGQITAIGLPWIRDSSVVVFSSTSINVLVEDIGPDDINHIVKLLAANGYPKVSVTVK